MELGRWRHGITAAVAILISPPFGFITGAIAAIALWLLLADAGLPTWAHVLISAMAITAVPGLWFLVLPVLFVGPMARRIQEPAGHEQWMRRQAEVWQAHDAALMSLIDGPIRSVVAVGASEQVGATRITLIALDLSDAGGSFTLQYGTSEAPDEMSEPPVDVVARLADDASSTYALTGHSIDVAPTGGRTVLYFVPAPPPSATELHLTLDRLLALGRAEPILGPWVFSVRLPRRRERDGGL